ncbi:MAG: cytochrome c [Bacteroidia bacterium]|nr:cytochrome c [Bacteroidia bacterium]
MRAQILKNAVSILCLAGGSALLMSTTSESKRVMAPGPWVAPKSADTIKNPFKTKGTAQAVAEGKKIYASYCVPCHGEKGKGNGVAAAGLNPKPADHTSAKFQSQTDGAIFWKLSTGRPPMASYSGTLSVTQRWQVVNYMRTLAKPGK